MHGDLLSCYATDSLCSLCPCIEPRRKCRRAKAFWSPGSYESSPRAQETFASANMFTPSLPETHLISLVWVLWPKPTSQQEKTVSSKGCSCKQVQAGRQHFMLQLFADFTLCLQTPILLFSFFSFSKFLLFGIFWVWRIKLAIFLLWTHPTKEPKNSDV